MSEGFGVGCLHDLYEDSYEDALPVDLMSSGLDTLRHFVL